jgi:hypothetical protein
MNHDSLVRWRLPKDEKPKYFQILYSINGFSPQWLQPSMVLPLHCLVPHLTEDVTPLFYLISNGYKELVTLLNTRMNPFVNCLSYGDSKLKFIPLFSDAYKTNSRILEHYGQRTFKTIKEIR